MIHDRKSSQSKQNARKPALLTVVIPVYNEEISLPGVLEELVPYCHNRNWSLILVDDGSRDATSEILGKFEAIPGVKIIRHKVNRGYGGALKTGIMNVETPYLVTLDADGQHVVSDVDQLLKYALDEEADLVVGKRGKQGYSGLYRGIGKWLIRKFASLLMPIHIADLNSGFKLYRTELVQKYMFLCPDSMAFSDVITLIFIKKRNLVLEYPITIKQRSAGKGRG